MRVVRREAERPVDPRLELLRDDVLEPVGLVVDVVDVQAERLREVQLEQAVVADHLERDALARRASGARRGTSRARAGRAPSASSPSPTRMQARPTGPSRARRSSRGRRRPGACRRSSGSPGSTREQRCLAHGRRVTCARVPIQVGHSADPDDAFMVWALEAGKVDTRGLELEPVVVGHPDAERMGGRRQARGDGALRRRLPGGRRPLRRCCRTAPRSARATARSSSRASELTLDELRELEIVTPGPLTTATPRAAARARRRHPHARPAVRRGPRRGRLRARRGRAADPRGPAHLRRRRVCTSCSTSASGGRRRRGCRCRSASSPSRRDLDRARRRLGRAARGDRRRAREPRRGARATR